MRAFVQQIDFSGKLILLSLFIALLSFFFTWVQPDINGFQEHAYVLLIVFIYSVAKILLRKKLSKKIGYFFAIFGALLSFSYISNHIIESEGTIMRIYGYGPLIFMISCMLLFLGILKYKVKEE